MMKRIFSGIQPSGSLHLGNYLGAVKQWIKLQYEAEESFFCIVDLHAITVPQRPAELKSNILSLAALYLAAGVDPEKSVIFIQSSRPEHSELAWILNCQTSMGELSRMTQFKDKSGKFARESIPVGLFDYPVLMAADILLYDTTHVPVGEDQKQHVELARDLAQRFNQRFGSTLTLPRVIIQQGAARIVGLDNPNKKMSKSAASPNNYILLTDAAEVIRQKIKKAVTDSGSEIRSDSQKPAISNLLNILSEVSGRSIAILEQEFSGKSYNQFKEGLAEEIIGFLEPIQERYNHYMKNYEELRKILKSGSEAAGRRAEKKLKEVKEKLGLGL